MYTDLGDAELPFDPTGVLLKDYSAYCEVNGRPERDDVIDAVTYGEVVDPAGHAKRPRTRVLLRHPRGGPMHHDDLAPFADAVPHCTTLDVIKLTGCGISERGLLRLSEAAYKSPTLSVLAIDFNGPEGLVTEPDVRMPHREVTRASYRGGALREVDERREHDAKGKKSGAPPPKPKSKELLLQQREADEMERVTQRIAVPVGWAGPLFTGIQSLSLRGNGITDADIELMVPFLTDAASDLRILNLWGNRITGEGACCLADMLKINRRITALDLGSNDIDDTGFDALADVLLSVDVSPEEAQRARQRMLQVMNPIGSVAVGAPPSVPAELPVYPTYGELWAAARSEEGERTNSARNNKQQQARPTPGSRKGRETPSDRPRGEFDRDCVRLGDDRIRIPGCIQLWALSLSNNPKATLTGVESFIAVLERSEPQLERMDSPPDDSLDPYCGTLNLQRLDLFNATTQPSADPQSSAHGPTPEQAAAQRIDALLEDYKRRREAAVAMNMK